MFPSIRIFLLLFLLCQGIWAFSAEPDSTQALKALERGQVLFAEDQVDSALQYFTKAAEMYEALGLEDDVANSYLWISGCHYELNDCGKDQLFAEHALDIKKKIYGDMSTEAAGIMHDLGLTYIDCQDQEKGLDRLKTARSIFQKSGNEFEGELANVIGSIGWVYGVDGHYDSAFAYLVPSYEVRVRLLGPSDIKVASTAHMIGYFSIYAGKFEQADKFVRIGLKIRQKVLGPDHHETVQSWQKMGECQLYQRRRKESLPFFQHALAALSKRPEIAENLDLNPNLEDVESLNILRELLNMKATALHYMNIANPADTTSLRRSKSSNDLALAASDQLQKYYTTRGSRAAALTHNTQIVSRAMLIEEASFKANHDPIHLENTHEHMEQSRNSLLRLSIHDDEATVGAELPATLISQLDSVEKTLAKVEYDLSLMDQSDSLAVVKRKLKLEAQLEHESLMNNIEQSAKPQ